MLVLVLVLVPVLVLVLAQVPELASVPGPALPPL